MAKKGIKFTDQHKMKLKKAKLKNPVRYWLGKKRDEKTTNKIRKTLTGRKNGSPSKITRQKIGEANKGKLKGRKQLQETIEKRKKSMIGKNK